MRNSWGLLNIGAYYLRCWVGIPGYKVLIPPRLPSSESGIRVPCLKRAIGQELFVQSLNGELKRFLSGSRVSETLIKMRYSEIDVFLLWRLTDCVSEVVEPIGVEIFRMRTILNRTIGFSRHLFASRDSRQTLSEIFSSSPIRALGRLGSAALPRN